MSGSAYIETVIHVILACRGVFKALTYRYLSAKIGVAMRWLFLIFFFFHSIAFAGQAEQEEVDQVLEGLRPCLLAFVHLNKNNNGVIQREARLQLFLKVDEELFSVENQQKMAAKFKQIVDQSLYLLIGKAQQNASKEDQEYILDKMRPIVKELEVLAATPPQDLQSWGRELKGCVEKYDLLK